MTCNLRWGWVFLERTRIISGIPFTTHFIDFFVVEMKRFFGSTVNVMLTRQTCGQRSSRAAGGKRRVLAFCISYEFGTCSENQKCRGDWDLGLCTTSGFAKKCSCALPTSEKFCGQTRFLIGSRYCATAFFLQVPKLQKECGTEVVHKPGSNSPLHFGSSFAASNSRLQYYQQIWFQQKKIDEMRYNLDSTENPRSLEKYPTSP